MNSPEVICLSDEDGDAVLDGAGEGSVESPEEANVETGGVDGSGTATREGSAAAAPGVAAALATDEAVDESALVRDGQADDTIAPLLRMVEAELGPVDDGTGTRVPAWDLILQQLAQIDAATFWTFAAIGAVVRFSGVLASMYRWFLVLRGQLIEMPFRHILGAFLIGRAIGFFLPSTAGLDGYKLYDAARFSGRTVEVTGRIPIALRAPR